MISMLVPPKKWETVKWNAHELPSEDGNNRDDSQEDRPRQGDPAHGMVQGSLVAMPGSHAGNITAVFLQIVSDLQLVELSGDPEVREEQNHRRIKDVDKAGCLRSAGGSIYVGKKLDVMPAGPALRKNLGKHQDRLGKNDRHHARIVDPQRHERTAAGVQPCVQPPVARTGRGSFAAPE